MFKAEEPLALYADAYPDASTRLPILRALEEREHIGRHIVGRLPRRIMTDVGADLERRARDACGEVLLLGPRKDAVAVPTEDQHRAAELGAIRRRIGREKAPST